MPTTEIYFNEELDTYILKIDGQEIATGEMETLADLSEELHARTKCKLYGSYAYNKKDPSKKPGLCVNDDCRKCGWNPDVAKARIKKLRADKGMGDDV